jgi:hypothetical protein
LVWLKKNPTWHADAAVAATLVNTGALVLAGVALTLVDIRLAARPREPLHTNINICTNYRLYSHQEGKLYGKPLGQSSAGKTKCRYWEMMFVVQASPLREVNVSDKLEQNATEFSDSG